MVNVYSSQSMAPLEPVKGEILKTDSNRPSVPPGHPMVDQQGQFKKGSPSRDHGCGVLPVHRQQYSGLGCTLARINCIWHLVPGPIPATHQCPGAPRHMAWPKSFQPESGECKSCAHVCGCLPEKSGGGDQIVSNERFSHIHMYVGREEGNDNSSPSPSQTSERVSGPSVMEGQILKTEWSLNQTIADWIFRAWGKPFVDLFTLRINTKLTTHISPFGRKYHGKWTVLSRTGTACTPIHTHRQA